MRRLLAVLLCTVTLAGCSSLGMTKIPDELLTCKDAPLSPAEDPNATMEDGPLYVPELAAAGQDCRSNLGDVRRLLKEEPTK